ncbi:MAG TPA: filamentous hemagglutinin N-terminal domain-containing protein [Burkholderiales bacterium]|nr:filamentous hemagglutinin N-terminal domain-containing protein [Burkholderiales bacterium]
MPRKSRVEVLGASFGRTRAGRLSIFAVSCLLLGQMLCSSISRAQVTSITSNGLNTTVTQNGGTHDITGGTPIGSNLFHSFGEFSVGPGDIANFNNLNALPISNILGRVTDGTSNIYGTIQTTGFGTANLFLINPAGWIFGPGASLNVGGGFHVSTANYISLSDGAQFSAVPGPGDALLTTAPPAAFGFSGPAVAPISVEGSVLAVAEGMTLSLVGGNVSVTESILSAPSGRIQIAGVAPNPDGDVTVAIPNFGVSSFSSLDQITISASVLDTSGMPIVDEFDTVIGGGPGGEILIRGGRLVVSDSIVQTGGYGALNGTIPKIDVAVTDDILLSNSSLDVSGKQVFDIDGNLVGGAGGAVVLRGASLTANGSVMFAGTSGISNGATLGIDVEITNDVTLSGSLLFAFTEGAGNGGGVRISAESVRLQEFNGISTVTAGAGQAGDIGINAASVTLDTASITSETFGIGSGGQITVNATDGGSLLMSNGSGISSVSSSEGAGGSIVLTSPLITLDGLSFVLSQSFGTAAGGDLVVEAGDLTLTGGANLRSETGGAPGGNIFATANGAAMISGEGSGIFSGGSGIEGAPAGNISLEAQQLTLTSGGAIQNGTILDRAGSISIAVTDSIVISDRGKILSQAFVNDVGDVTISAPTASLVMDTGLIQTSTIQQGDAGDINVNVATLSLMNGAQIVTSSAEAATGLGGDLTITANSVSISGSSPGEPVSVLSGNDPSSGLFSTASGSLDPLAKGGGQINVTTSLLTISDGAKISAFTPGAGPAGDITLDASTLSVAGGAQVVSSTTSSGDAGSIAVVGTQADILSGGRVISESGGLIDGIPTVGGGASGSVSITATNAITVSGAGSAVSTTTFGDGDGGSVTLTAAQVSIQNGGQVESQSGGTLGGALVVGAGDAGTVTIKATGTNTLTISGPGSTVSTSTLGAGDGGDVVLISAGDVKILDGGSVNADSLGGAGFTGTIDVTAGNSIFMNNGTISTRAVTSDGGNIKLTAPNIVQLEGSQITTSVESGVGGGGNINIDPQFVIVNNSSIIANAFGGPGGNITIIADNFLSSATSLITASSALSTPGVIEVRSPENNVENNIAQLPAAFVDASALLRGLCTARRTGAPSSFVVAGRGGVPVDADGYLPAFSTDLTAATAGRTGEQPFIFALLANTPDCAR